jgi:hypothetical protein
VSTRSVRVCALQPGQARTVVPLHKAPDPLQPLRDEERRQDRLRKRLRNVHPPFDWTAHHELDFEQRAERQAAVRISDTEHALAPLQLATLAEYTRRMLATVALCTELPAPLLAGLLAQRAVDLADVDVDGEAAYRAMLRAIELAERRGYERGRADEVAARMADDDAP